MSDVLILCEYPVLNGGERSMLSVLPNVVADGLRVAVAGPGESPLEQAVTQLHVPYHRLSLQSSSLPTPAARATLTQRRQRLAALLQRLRPTLVHANSLAMTRLAGPVVARLPSLVGIGHIRDIVGLSRRAVRDVNQMDRLIAVSQATRHWHVQRGVDPTRLDVLPNGVDTCRFRPRPPSGYLHRELGLPKDAELVGGIGQLGMRKGWDILLAAACQAAAREPRLHWLIAGVRNSQKHESIEFEQRLRTAARDSSLDGRVHFLGWREDTPELLNEWQFLVHPARQEPLGRVLLEAAAAGLAVIATDVGGTAEIFPPHAHAAWLLPPNDPTALAESMIQLYRDPHQRHLLGQQARSRVLGHFHATQAARQLITLYRSCLP